MSVNLAQLNKRLDWRLIAWVVLAWMGQVAQAETAPVRFHRPVAPKSLARSATIHRLRSTCPRQRGRLAWLHRGGGHRHPPGPPTGWHGPSVSGSGPLWSCPARCRTPGPVLAMETVLRFCSAGRLRGERSDLGFVWQHRFFIAPHLHFALQVIRAKSDQFEAVSQPFAFPWAAGPGVIVPRAGMALWR